LIGIRYSQTQNKTMRLDTLSKNSVESFGDKTTLKFGIDLENMGLVYKSFLNYSDVIGSIVREYTSNCFDSHAEAGIDSPVKVTFNPINYITGQAASIEFTDVGVGLSPERIEHVFCKFFTSTKRESNTYIGAYGIGAKSALGYTDMFTIVTRYDSIEYVYAVHLGETSPEMDLLNSYPTKESNGTTVKIDIKSGDEHKFKTAIKEQLKYFDNIEYEGIDIENYSLIRGKNFILNDKYTTELEICYGKIRYPINMGLLNINNTFSQMYQTDDRFHRNLYVTSTNFPFALHFDIGDIEVVWNREAINYTSKTIDTIIEKFKNALLELADLYDNQRDKIANLEDLYNLNLAAQDNYAVIKVQNATILAKFLSKKITYKGIEFKNLNFIINNEFFNHHLVYFPGSNTTSNAERYKSSIKNIIQVPFKTLTVTDRVDKKKIYVYTKRKSITENINVIKSIYANKRSDIQKRHPDLDIKELDDLYNKIYKKFNNLDKITLTEEELAEYKENNTVIKKYSLGGYM
jgi:hypothetical protein